MRRILRKDPARRPSSIRHGRTLDGFRFLKITQSVVKWYAMGSHGALSGWLRSVLMAARTASLNESRASHGLAITVDPKPCPE
jgi:hypothetical protein